MPSKKTKEKLSIVKIGGNIIENEKELQKFLKLFAAIDGYKLLVHGGGQSASKVSEKMGIPTQMVNGRRITDEAFLDVALMVYAGLVNKKVVASLQQLGCNAIGMSGADAGTILAHKRIVNQVDYGLAGDVDKVNYERIGILSELGLTPIFCPITHDGKGQLLNTNADTIAAELAGSMSFRFETTLYYCFEKPGVLIDINDESSVIKHINSETYQELLQKKIIADGMLPKMYNCFYALEKGASKVCIGNLGLFHKKKSLYTTLSL